MLRTRVIPTLLLDGDRLVKTTRFRAPQYVGDPINAIRIFNDKEADELVLLDVTASRKGCGPAFATIERVANECFMPLAYGGGITTLEEMRRVLGAGIEKVVVNMAALRDPGIVTRGATEFGSQAIIVSIDAKRGMFGGYRVTANGGRKPTREAPAQWARQMEEAGAGEILLSSVDRDGTMSGYDLDLVASVAQAVRVPVIASGGAGSLADFKLAVAAGASAVAAGAMFVFRGPHRAVLITYPSRGELTQVLG